MGKLLKLLGIATKTGIAGGAVYVSVDQGLWGKSEQTDKIYDKIYETAPEIKEFPKSFVKDYLPDTEGYQSFGFYWNKAVFFTFNFIANLPTKVVSGKDYVVDLVSDLASQTTEPPKQESS